MSRKLHYFNLNGIGEPIRYIFHYGKLQFEDIRYDLKDWPKEKLPYGQLPLYEEGNRTLNQSIAIARYAASQCGLLPSDPWEQAVLDNAVLNMYDFRTKLFRYILETDPVKKQALKKEVQNEHVEFYFSRFEKELKAHNGHFSGKLSWADFILVGFVEAANLFLDAEIEKNYPTISSLMQKIWSLPGVKEYIATRKPYVNPIN